MYSLVAINGLQFFPAYPLVSDNDALKPKKAHFNCVLFFSSLELRKPIIEVSGTGKEITVGDGSPVTMNIGDNVTAASNTTITIRCPVSGVPTPAVTWEKDGLTVTSGEKIVIVNENLLIIREAKGRFGGKYICNVKNGFGEKSLSSIIRILG